MQKDGTGISSYSLPIHKPEICIASKGAKSVEVTITWIKGKELGWPLIIKLVEPPHKKYW